MRKSTFIFLVIQQFYIVPFFAQNAKATKSIFSGTVKDHEGNPVKRAVVFVDSAETINKTNNRGFYKFKTREVVENIAVFSEDKGMLSKDIKGNLVNDFEFSKGMPVINKADLSALGFTMLDDKTERYRKYNDIYELIATEFTGVSVRGTKIKVRGSATISGPGAEPLYIVDGNYVSSLDTVIPTEIESIEILKDQDATLYGARGANGVIIVKLKKQRK